MGESTIRGGGALLEMDSIRQPEASGAVSALANILLRPTLTAPILTSSDTRQAAPKARQQICPTIGQRLTTNWTLRRNSIDDFSINICENDEKIDMACFLPLVF